MGLTDQTDLLRGFSRRRVNLFFSGVILVAFLGVLIDEVADLGDIIDDGGLVILAAIAVAIIAMKWKSNTPEQLRSTNRIVMIIAVIMVLLTFFGLYNEFGDTAAFGDDIAQLIVTVTFLLNNLLP